MDVNLHFTLKLYSRLKVFEKKIQKRIFRYKEDVATEKCKKLHTGSSPLILFT
jgi:hypothetical protein